MWQNQTALVHLNLNRNFLPTALRRACTRSRTHTYMDTNMPTTLNIQYMGTRLHRLHYMTFTHLNIHYHMYVYHVICRPSAFRHIERYLDPVQARRRAHTPAPMRTTDTHKHRPARTHRHTAAWRHRPRAPPSPASPTPPRPPPPPPPPPPALAGACQRPGNLSWQGPGQGVRRRGAGRLGLGTRTEEPGWSMD